MKTKLDVLIVGGGMYVVGKGTDGYGTILPALFEAKIMGTVGRIGIVTTNSESALFAKNRALLLAEKMGVESECDYFPKKGRNPKAFIQALEDFQPNSAIVSVPDHLHASVSIPVLEKGIHCMVVKPMAPSIDDAAAMVKAARQSKVVAQVEFHKRLDESNLLLYDSIKSGELGSLLYAVVEYSQKKKIPRDVFRSWAEKSSIFQYLGVHYVDLLQYITGFTPKAVTAWGQNEYLKSIGIQTWDAMQVIIQWEKNNGNPFISTHITNWIDPDETTAMSDQKINIVGTNGRFQADQKNRGVQRVLDKKGVDDINPYFSSSRFDLESQRLCFEGYGIRSIQQFIDDVIKYENGSITLEQLEMSRPTFTNCRVSTAVIEAAHQSMSNNNKTIEVNLGK